MALVTERDLANTFATQRGLTPWERVQQYREVKSYASRHPDKGSSAVASALELPRGRIRSWVDSDGKPDPVRAIDRARKHGWLDIAPGTDTASGLIKLVAWIYSGGSIADTNYTPSFAIRRTDTGPDTIDLTVIETAFDEFGATPTVIQREEGRAVEVRVEGNPTLVGRVLAAAGAPVGEKADQDDLTLPGWLDDVYRFHQREFARIYLLNRATERDHSASYRYGIREVRSKTYLDDLTQFLTQLAGDDGISRYGRNIILSEHAISNLVD
ncbi:hypothetical protein [Haloarchaeobius sp. HRN-SO-5]|uniref:hypothetical protein n=1 Tax=Haloarchaeobius sp. HRN-SO-5 TaxID=3446118 RepID=UPI003EB7E8C0